MDKFLKLMDEAVSRIAELKLRYNRIVTSAEEYKPGDSYTPGVKMVPPIFWNMFGIVKPRRSYAKCGFCDRKFKTGDLVSTITVLGDDNKFMRYCSPCFLACLLLVFQKVVGTDMKGCQK